MNNSVPRQQRHTADLRKGRISVPDARYFITCSAARPESGLIHTTCGHSILDSIKDMAAGKDFTLYCATVMPDHIHMLLSPSGRLAISKIIAKFKALTRNALSNSNARWQANFFEHRLRPDELSNSYACYIFLNPYRAGLIERKAEWPYWIMGMSMDFDFYRFLEEEKYPPSEWLDDGAAKIDPKNDFIGRD